MIIGDPYKFGIGIDLVDTWETIDSPFKLGLLHYYSKNQTYPKFPIAATLNSELFHLIKVLAAVIEEYDDEPALFEDSPYNLIAKTNNPEEDFLGHLRFSTGTVEDYKDFFFMIKNKSQVRVVCIGDHYAGGRKNIVFDEVYLDLSYVQSILDHLRNYISEFLPNGETQDAGLVDRKGKIKEFH